MNEKVHVSCYSADYAGSTAYNFANRVVEGMSLYINTVVSRVVFRVVLI